MKISTFINRENNNLDLFRIILASMVIFGHAQTLNGDGGFWIDPIKSIADFEYSGSIAVKLFFFVSGLVVTHSLLAHKSAVYFFISRIFRIVPALVFVVVITAFVIGPIVTTLDLHTYFSDSEVVRYCVKNSAFVLYDQLPGVFKNNAFAGPVNGSLWTLGHEVRCYILLLGVFLVLYNRKKLYWNILILAVVIDSILPQRIVFAFIDGGPQVYLLPVAFAMGVFCAINADKIEINLRLVLGAFLVYYIFRKSALNELTFITAFSVLMLYLSSTKTVLKLRPKYDISYGIYLWGWLVQQTVFYFTGHINTWLHFVLSLVIAMILAYVTHRLVELPFMDLGKKLFRKIKERRPQVLDIA